MSDAQVATDGLSRFQLYRRKYPERVAAAERRYRLTSERSHEHRRAYVKEWQQKHPEAAIAHRKAQARYVAAYPERQRARIAVRNEIASGRLMPLPCRDCGVTKVHAHHLNGYGPAHVLDVVWLCSLHHAKEHRLVTD